MKIIRPNQMISHFESRWSWGREGDNVPPPLTECKLYTIQWPRSIHKTVVLSRTNIIPLYKANRLLECTVHHCKWENYFPKVTHWKWHSALRICALLFPQNLYILMLVVLALPIFFLRRLMDPKYLEVC